MRELEKVYDPSSVENNIYKRWEDGGYFVGHIDPKKKPFTIVIPPPNVTGQLHLGHAFDNTLQDILIRYKRMCGYAALWVPGTDHAGIATQIRVEEELRGEGLSRHDLGREKFVERVWEWKHLYGNIIIDQLKRLGSSCDWSRERFTMDEGCSRAVREVFVSLYEKGLIYKGYRIINWCPSCTTALSDAEVEYEERESFLYHLLYPVIGSSEKLVVATTRPETMLGDTGVAVHPADKRYSHLVGKTVLLPLADREIPIIADEYVDLEFGTGCVKVTPCHDPNDFEIGQRHDLEQVLMLDGDAKVINSGKYNGLDRYDARREVVADLSELGLLVKTEPHKNNVGVCHRCGTTVEPVTSEQWFVKMRPLADGAIKVVADGSTKFVPDRFSKIYIHWMENVRDWCISRQLWWGHRIPAWTCADCSHITVSREDPQACEKCESVDITQDDDVLDTWFSSALWPFSTLGWPENTSYLEYFYPTDVLVTGYDIIFFWVARMIFSGVEHTGKTPFHTVFIHGMIRDEHGRKMSKSLGNGIDPLDLIDTYGADALRFYIVTGNSPGNDIRFYSERCQAMRNFANKIWNAARFVLMNTRQGDGSPVLSTDTPRQGDGSPVLFAGQGDGQAVTKPRHCEGACDRSNPETHSGQENRPPVLTPALSPTLLSLPLELEDKWILSKLNTLAGEVCENIDKFELGIAASKLYDFIWDDFCDWYIELAKPRLANLQTTSEQSQGVDGISGDCADVSSDFDGILEVLVYVLKEFLTLLHPFMPFITEEIYQALPQAAGDEKMLIVRPYPKYSGALCFKAEEAEFESITAAVRAVRARRAEMNVPPSKKSTLIIVTDKPHIFERGNAYIGRLAYASEVAIANRAPDNASGYVTAATNDARLYMPLSELVDVEKERERIAKEIAKAKTDIERTQQKLSNKEFTAKAPEKVVQAERDKLVKQQALLDNLEKGLAGL